MFQPTDPQNDIKGACNCELWNKQVDLVIPPPVQETTHDSEQYDTPSQLPQEEDWLTKVTLPKFQTLPEVTCMCVRHRWKMLQHHHPSAPQRFTGCI
jgi:hypothetical protein